MDLISMRFLKFLVLVFSIWIQMNGNKKGHYTSFNSQNEKVRDIRSSKHSKEVKELPITIS
jgi:hypothetical protein